MTPRRADADRRRAAARRWLRTGLGVAALHLILGTAGALLTGLPDFLLFFGLCAALTAAVAGALYGVLRAERGGGGHGGGGLGTPPRGTPPDGPDAGGEPPWWPAFERALRDYERQLRVRG